MSDKELKIVLVEGIAELCRRNDQYRTEIASLTAQLANCREALEHTRPFIELLRAERETTFPNGVQPVKHDGQTRDILAEIDRALARGERQ